MKKLLFAVMILALFSCKKENKVNNSENGGPLNFISLTVADSVLHVNVPSLFKANATGAGLTYTWSCDWGTFIGSGANIQWVACHSAIIPVSCTVSDASSQSQTKTINVKVEP